MSAGLIAWLPEAEQERAEQVDAELHTLRHASPHPDCPECMIPLSVAADAVLCKLSEAKPGDVLVITADNLRDARDLAHALADCRLPTGSLPEGGVPVVVARTGTTLDLRDWPNNLSDEQIDKIIAYREQQRKDASGWPLRDNPSAGGT